MVQRVTKVSGASPQLPVTLELVKQHMSLTTDDLDELVVQNLTNAVAWVEERTRRAIAQRSYLVTMQDFPRVEWVLPLGKVQSITSVQYVDSDGATQTWSSALYQVDTDSDVAARLRPIPSEDWPDADSEYLAAARVTMVAGFTVDDVPESLQQAILMRTAQYFDSRAPGDPAMLPMERATEALIAPYTLPFWS